MTSPADQSDVLRLLSGRAISDFGSGITAAALPLIAALLLGASAADMGWLLAAESAPVLLVGLFAGVWIDRVARRPLLVVADLGRALLLAAIPVLATLDVLRMEHLFLVALGSGLLSVVFDVAYRSFVPDLVGRDAVLGVNTRLASIQATAEITTPGLTGALVQVIAAPLVILADAVSFVVSAVCLLSLRFREPARPARASQPRVLRDVLEGFRAVRGQPVLLNLTIAQAVRNFFGMFIGALYVVYGLRELDLTPFLIGVTVGVGGGSNLLGTLLVEPLTRRFGLSRTAVGAALVGCCGPLLVGLAPGQTLAGFVFLLGAQALDAHYPLYEVNVLTLRQVLMPPHLLGRVNATIHVATRGVVPLGAIAGGVLGDALGLRPTLLLAALGIILSGLWLLRAAPTPSQPQRRPRG